jgi:hypothetical protein
MAELSPPCVGETTNNRDSLRRAFSSTAIIAESFFNKQKHIQFKHPDQRILPHP